MERELKLRIPIEDLEKLRHAPLFAQSKGAADAPKLLISTYFDTRELAFHRCKASPRVRAVGNERLQTLKLEGSVQAGLFDREEFEIDFQPSETSANLDFNRSGLPHHPIQS
jgi:triphosphatase